MGSPILILHGWGSCAKNWGRVKELLEGQGCKVFVPDLPGFGENPQPLKPWSLDDYTEWLKEFCEKNNLSQVFLLGHSFGGGVAVKYALNYPESIKKLFLVAPAIVRKKTFKKEIMKKTAKIFSFLPLSVKKIIYRKIIGSDYPLAKGPMRETYLKIINEDLSRELVKVSAPTLLIWGKKDDVLPIKNAYFIKEKIKNSKLIVIPEANHDLERKVPEILVEKIIQNVK